MSNPDLNLKQSVFNKARKDKFLLIFTLPSILRDLNMPILSLRGEDVVKQDNMQYSIYGSPVPDVVVPAVTMSYDGQPYKVTSQTRQPYPPILVNFTIDNRFANWWVIWKWLDTMNLHRDSGMDDHFGQWGAGSNPEQDVRSKAGDIHKQLVSSNSPKKNEIVAKDNHREKIYMTNNFLDYQTTITIFALDEYNNKIVEFTYHNAFPTSLGGIQYSYRDHTEAESNFQFEFSQMDVKLVGAGY